MHIEIEKKFKDITSIAELLLQKTSRLKADNSQCTASSLPGEISFKITTRCNLRCKHCYLWNEKGFYRQFLKNSISKDMDLRIIDKALFETKESNTAIRISGGEPLIHHNWFELVEILSKYNRKVSLFTNGFLINKSIEQLLEISKNLNIVVSLDGLAYEHNLNRGKNTFSKVIKNINLLVSLKKQKIYNGNITINTFISNELACNLSEYLQFVTTLEVDKVFLNFPWFIGNSDIIKMDKFYENRFAGMYNKPLQTIPSWHSFTYQLSDDNVKKTRTILKNHKETILKKGIRINPFTEYNEAIGKNRCNNSNSFPSFCLAPSRSMIIQTNGMVTACTAFPELEVESADKRSIKEIWNSEKYNSIRKVLNVSLWTGKACLKCPYLSTNFYNL